MGKMENPENIGALSRRDMLKTSAVVGLGLAAIGVSGCSSASSSDASSDSSSDYQWDEETDFIVVGAGTGLFAALAAANEGKDVIVFEKSESYGGTTFLSGGGFWIPRNHMMDDPDADDPDEVLAYMKACDLYGTADEEVCVDYIANCTIAGEYVANTLGFPLAVSLIRDYNNYEYWGQRQLSLVDSEGTASGAAAWTASARPIVDDAGLDIRFSTEVTKLLTDDSGAVVGICATSGSDEIYVKANSGVLLATGGIDQNEEMRKAYLRGPLTGTVMVSTDTGDGHRMGLRLNAKLMNMPSVYGTNAFVTSEDGLSTQFDHYTHRSRPNSIIVNSGGKRFFNEGGSYVTSGTALWNINCEGTASLASPAIFVCDSRFVEDYGFGGTPGEAPSDWVREYDSLESLAEGEGIDVERFLEEVERFNGFCETGVDRDFHRGETGFEEIPIGLASIGLVERDDLVNPYLGPIETAPFYAASYGAASFGTSGGLKVNKYAQVINEDDEVIPNLYATGCCAASLVSGYPGPGTSIATGMYRSIRAVDHALGLGIIE